MKRLPLVASDVGESRFSACPGRYHQKVNTDHYMTNVHKGRAVGLCGSTGVPEQGLAGGWWPNVFGRSRWLQPRYRRQALESPPASTIGRISTSWGIVVAAGHWFSSNAPRTDRNPTVRPQSPRHGRWSGKPSGGVLHTSDRSSAEVRFGGAGPPNLSITPKGSRGRLI